MFILANRRYADAGDCWFYGRLVLVSWHVPGVNYLAGSYDWFSPGGTFHHYPRGSANVGHLAYRTDVQGD